MATGTPEKNLKEERISKRDAAGQAPTEDDGLEERRSVTAAARLLAGLTLLSRISGLARDVVISSVFGTSAGADAFFVAFRIPNLFRRVVGEGATSAAFVPVFTSHLVKDGKQGVIKAASAVGTAAFVVLGLLVTLGVLFAEPIVTMFAPGFTADPAKAELTIALTKWTFPYLFVVGAAAWAMGVLHTFRNFATPAYGPILLNGSIIAAALMLSGVFEPSVFALVVGVLVGGFFQFVVQVPALFRLGFRPRMMLAVRHPSVPRVGRLIGAAVLGGAVYQINILVATVFASLLPAGSVSWLWYADRVFEFPLGIVAVAIGTAALPSLSRLAGQGRMDDVADGVSHALRMTLALCIPAAVALWLLAPVIVSVLFERGEFSSHDTAMTVLALRAYIPGIFGVAAVRVLATTFYALERPRIPVIAAVVALVVNALGDLALMGPVNRELQWWGAGVVVSLNEALAVADLRHAGLSLAAGIAATVNAGLLYLLLMRELPGLRFRELAASCSVHGVAAVGMGVALSLCEWLAGPVGVGWTQMLWLAVAMAVGGSVYLGLSLLFGSTEVRELFMLGRSRSKA